MNRKISAYISLGLCILFSVLLLVWLFAFPQFFEWFYVVYHKLNADAPYIAHAVKTVVASFYVCAPFAAAALYLLIRLLLNVIKDNTFAAVNVTYLRFVSWCCYAVALITGIASLYYMPLVLITAGMAVVGTLLRVVKNLMQSAVEIKEENDLTV